jgi:general secretion pathway protein K
MPLTEKTPQKRDVTFRNSSTGHDQRGMALLITIMTLSLLTAITIQYHKVSWHNFVVSDNYKRGVQLKSISESGVNIALAALIDDLSENVADSFSDSWALLEQENFDLLFPSGELQLRVNDLSGRLQINMLAEENKAASEANNTDTSAELRNILQNLLVSGIFPIEDDTEAQEIIDAIVDWIDEDDLESDHGAENSYYQSLDQPYSARNGPLTSIEELLLVRGITPEIFFGNDGDKGLKDFLTVYGEDGKININTAETELIKSMNPLITDELAEQFDEFRNDKDNNDSFNDPNWYKAIGWPGDIELNQKIITTISQYFQITATGKFDTLSWTMVADAGRAEDGTINLLRKKVE